MYQLHTINPPPPTCIFFITYKMSIQKKYVSVTRICHITSECSASTITSRRLVGDDCGFSAHVSEWSGHHFCCIFGLVGANKTTKKLFISNCIKRLNKLAANKIFTINPLKSNFKTTVCRKRSPVYRSVFDLSIYPENSLTFKKENKKAFIISLIWSLSPYLHV